MIGFIQIAIYIATGFLFLKWIHRANHNVRALGASGLQFTPGWSIGYYFIPIYNLWKPYQAMKEIWKSSKNPANWADETANPILSWWWFFWIVSGLVGNLSFRLSMRAEEISELLVANVVALIVDIVAISLSIIALESGPHCQDQFEANLRWIAFLCSIGISFLR